jgi:hypothetical protein
MFINLYTSISLISSKSSCRSNISPLFSVHYASLHAQVTDIAPTPLSVLNVTTENQKFVQT